MSDRIKGFYVSLENDIKDEDFSEIENAVKMIRGVLNVTPYVTSAEDHINREQIKFELKRKLWDILK